jgi:hypothetical protein
MTINDVRKEYDAFEYRSVILKAEKLLMQKDSLNKTDLIEIYVMEGVAHYALAEEQEARKSFIEILKLDRNYEIDPEKISPKIVAIFSEIRNDYNQLIPRTPVVTEQKKSEPVVKEEPPKQIKTSIIAEGFEEYKKAVPKSLLFPGWGHFSIGKSTKGLIFSAAALVSFSSMIYYIVKANNSEQSYLNETDAAIIQSKYNDYNNNYKLRNFFITSSILIWTYTQLDFLLFDVNDYTKAGLTYNSNNLLKSVPSFSLTFKLQF